jgi:SAM-dependent methyltransferase
MLPDKLDFRHRAQLTERIDEPCSRDELRACLRDVARLNRWFLGYRPTLQWLESLVLGARSRSIHILDVGCGYGDGLRRIEQWAHMRGIAVELTGIDINPDAAAIAAEATLPSSRIRWHAANVFTYRPPKPIDLVVSALFTHHLSEPHVVRFLEWMEQNATLGWFINDLSRSPVPYHLLGIFSKIARLHPFVQHDGPVSFARAFVEQDWREMCASASLDERAYTLKACKPARLCVARRIRQ